MNDAASKMTVSAAQAEELRAELKALKACSKGWLLSEYQRSHRVCDPRELTKLDLVWGVLAAKHGQHRLDAVFG